MTRQQRQRTPAAATEPSAGASTDEVDQPAAEPTEAQRLVDALAVLQAQFVDLREQVEEHHAVLATRIERRRRRIEHPRLYPQ